MSTRPRADVLYGAAGMCGNDVSRRSCVKSCPFQNHHYCLIETSAIVKQQRVHAELQQIYSADSARAHDRYQCRRMRPQQLHSDSPCEFGLLQSFTYHRIRVHTDMCHFNLLACSRVQIHVLIELLHSNCDDLGTCWISPFSVWGCNWAWLPRGRLVLPDRCECLQRSLFGTWYMGCVIFTMRTSLPSMCESRSLVGCIPDRCARQ